MKPAAEIIDHSGLVSQMVIGPGIKDFASYIPPAQRFLKFIVNHLNNSAPIFSHNKIAFWMVSLSSPMTSMMRSRFRFSREDHAAI
jgi:hypothetical protein